MQIGHEESAWPLTKAHNGGSTESKGASQGATRDQQFVPAAQQNTPDSFSPSPALQASSPVAPEAARYMIDTMQEKTQPSANNTGLPDAQRNGLEDIANDPAYAARRARELGTLHVLSLTTEDDFPKNGDPSSVWTAFAQKMNVRMAQAEDLRQQRNALYDSLVEKGVPPAEIYAELLDFQANLPDAMVKNQGYATNINVSWEEWNTASSDYLRQAIAKNNNPGSLDG